MDDLIHSSVGGRGKVDAQSLWGVLGWVDKLTHYGSMGRVDKLHSITTQQDVEDKGPRIGQG